MAASSHADAAGPRAAMTEEAREGLVLNIQRMSTEDGPGLRTTAFLKGCPLRCSWCHNPESLSPRPEVEWFANRCIAAAAAASKATAVAAANSAAEGCGRCVRACPTGALARASDGAVVVDRARCDGCSGGGAADSGKPAGGARCVEACPAGAMEALGTRYTAEALAAELARDAAWFSKSDRGGVTLSGGEASAQAGFSRNVLRLLAEMGIHTALDTCGFASWDALSSLYPYVDLLLWDLKEADNALHERWTGLGNDLVLANLEKTAAWMRERGSPRAIWIRTPVIPGATDREENLEALGELLARIAPPRLERWELCAFNKLCADKYRRLGRDWAFASAPLMKAEDMERLALAARRGLGTGGRDGIVTWTGATALEAGRKEA